MNIHILLFADFETLDAFGPVEILARHPDHVLRYVSVCGGMVESAQHTQIQTEPVSVVEAGDVLLVPGGRGTRTLVHDGAFLEALGIACRKASYVLSVCTGSALLAKAGVLDGLRATSNKKAFDWACGCGSAVRWIRSARWVHDGRCYTSSGVSAGMDMALGFMADRYGEGAARSVAEDIEYVWNSDSTRDIFCKIRYD